MRFLTGGNLKAASELFFLSLPLNLHYLFLSMYQGLVFFACFFCIYVLKKGLPQFWAFCSNPFIQVSDYSAI